MGSLLIKWVLMVPPSGQPQLQVAQLLRFIYSHVCWLECGLPQRQYQSGWSSFWKGKRSFPVPMIHNPKTCLQYQQRKLQSAETELQSGIAVLELGFTLLMRLKSSSISN